MHLPSTSEKIPDYKTLYNNHERKVRYYVSQFKFPNHLTEDLVQETFLNGWTNLGSLRNINSFGSWIIKIARNLCLKELQKNKVQKISIERVSHNGTSANFLNYSLVAKDYCKTLELETKLNKLRSFMTECNNPIRSKIASQYYIEEKPVKHICTVLDLNQNTVLSHLRRFRSKLAPEMRKIYAE